MILALNTDLSCINEKEFSNKKNLKKFEQISNYLHSNAEWTGWVDYPKKVLKKLPKLEKLAYEVRKKADVLLVLGIGGSYLGAYAGLTAIEKKSKTEVLFAGLNFSYEEIEKKLLYCKDKEVYVNVISKSGTTTETMIAFEFVLKFLKKKYKKDFASHIVITTDKNKGYLNDFAKENNILSLEVPDNIGGRYSVLTDVGLFPFLCGGLDVKSLLGGAKKASVELSNISSENPAYRYSLSRYLLNTKKKKQVEVLSTFYPRLKNIGAWWMQLFAESEGKNKKGLFVSSLNFSTDLHSIGQFIQEGSPILFETFLSVNKISKDKSITSVGDKNPIKYLEGKTLQEINLGAELGTIEAHSSANVPIIKITINEINEENLGYLFYFFEYSCALSGLLLGIDPFNQPGVEAYKANMKKNLTK